MWHLKRAIIFWLIAILAGWYGISEGGKMGDPRKRGNCVAEAIQNAEEWIEKTGRPAMIAVFNVKPGYDHSQAIGKDEDGYYKFLTRHHSDGKLRKWVRHYDSEPYRYLKVEDFVKEQEQVEE